MSFSADVEVSGTCDACGKSLDEGDATYCEKCAGPHKAATNAAGKCRWMWGRHEGEYICGSTYEEWQWKGPMPPYCPHCGRPL